MSECNCAHCERELKKIGKSLEVIVAGLNQLSRELSVVSGRIRQHDEILDSLNKERMAK